MKNCRRILSLLIAILLCFGCCLCVNAADVPTFTTGDQTLDMIEYYEGYISTPQYGYIGFGSSYSDAEAMFGAGVSYITREQARALTRSELASTERYINSFLTRNGISINQNQFDALMDFTYNVGIGWTSYQNDDGTPCMLKQLLLDGPSAWTYEQVHKAFGVWCKSDGQVLPGLVTRRAAEADMFLTAAPTTPVTTVAGMTFTDLEPDAWYYNHVCRAITLGIMKGNGGGIFAPQDQLTRAQLVMILANFDGADLPYYRYAVYHDVFSEDWYFSCVTWATANGYVYGVGDGCFDPNTPVTREDLCTIIARYLRAKGYSTGDNTRYFADAGCISSYAVNAVQLCSSLNLIYGKGNDLFAPKDNATRAEAATIFCRMYNLLYA